MTMKLNTLVPAIVGVSLIVLGLLLVAADFPPPIVRNDLTTNSPNITFDSVVVGSFVLGTNVVWTGVNTNLTATNAGITRSLIIRASNGSNYIVPLYHLP